MIRDLQSYLADVGISLEWPMSILDSSFLPVMPLDFRRIPKFGRNVLWT